MGLFDWFRRKPKSASKQSLINELEETLRQSMGASAFEAFKLAQKDPPRDAWMPPAYSGNTAVLSSYDLLDRRVRDLLRNHPQARKIRDSFVNLVVGRGVQTFSNPFKTIESNVVLEEIKQLVDGETGPRFSYALESDDLFEEWASDCTQVDAEGRLDWTQMQRMLMGESVAVGTGLLIRVTPLKYKRIPIAYQLIEREQLDRSQDTPGSKTENKIVGGVEMTPKNVVVAYHVFTEHPADAFGGFTGTTFQGIGMPITSGQYTERITADRVIDLTLFHRPSAALGNSWFDAIGQSIFDRGSFMDSEIRTSALNAIFAFVAKLKDADTNVPDEFSPDLDSSPATNSRGDYRLGTAPQAQVICPDEEISMVRAERPNPNANNFMNLIDHDIAAGSGGLSYYTLTNDYAQTNFSSAHGAKLDEDLAIAPLQQWFQRVVALRVRSEVNTMLAIFDQFETVTPKEFEKNKRLYNRFDAISPWRGQLDPMRETEALISALRSGLSTFQQACARKGLHWIKQAAQIANEHALFESLGITLDHSKNASGVTASGQVGEQVLDANNAERL